MIEKNLLMKQENIENLLKQQEKFSNLFYDKDEMSPKEKEEMLKTLTLAMHSEVTEIVSSCDYKIFDKCNFTFDRDKLIYNSIDVFRYLLAIMNLYEISANQFLNAFEERDVQLKLSNSLKLPAENQKVIVVDIDDVVCKFRAHFNNWLAFTYNIYINPDSTSYYSSKEVKNHGYSPEGVFERFISENELLTIPPVETMVKFLKLAKDDGYYIQLLTSRPENNLKCKYQTYLWLERNNIPFDNIGFAAEKYIWVSKKDFYIKGNLVAAIDDSPKHAMEYATHDVKVLVPRTSYNKSLRHKNISHFNLENLNNIKF